MKVFDKTHKLPWMMCSIGEGDKLELPRKLMSPQLRPQNFAYTKINRIYLYFNLHNFKALDVFSGL